ncbi:hypothetical protein LPTSP4_01560 [Leptospira ryugenii]|uniref:histidine kinase n=1 Tax=Leptospira ryugenii TaxID=1917863 RepID=A0A2P2DVJ5_9LEPT|nr:histidine kinase dimerization/phosphoacceptor domain -containing protein [Leptospira ryugenii]GBF48656.1 hypothetical protein LPTSP4_01560 [Leptospira ryugenii]
MDGISDSHFLLQMVGENYPNGSISLIDQNLHFIYTNGSGFKKFGIDPSSFLRKSIFEVLQPEVYTPIKANLPKVLSGESVVHEVSTRNSHFLNAYKPIVNAEGKVEAFILTSQDITEFKRLEAEHVKLKNVIQKSINEIYIFDPETFKIEYVNDAGLKNLKYNFEEVKQKTIFDIKTNIKEETFKSWIKPVLDRQTETIVFETINKRSDGSFYPVEVHLQLVFHEGKSSIFTIVLDISNVKQYEMNIQEKKEELAATIEELNATTEELKEQNDQLLKLLEEKENLFKEIHHRIKNNLQMILSLLYIKSLNTKDPNLINFIQDTKNRILSISLLHEQLLKLKSINKLDINQYFSSLIQNIMASYKEPNKDYKLHFDVERFELSTDKIVYLGLITNEIISNIYKHAYPNQPNGDIFFKCLRNGSRCSFSIGDKGKGKLDFSKASKSYGTQLIQIFSDQLNARLTIDTTNGLFYIIEFEIE